MIVFVAEYVDFKVKKLTLAKLAEVLIARAHLKGYTLIRCCGKRYDDSPNLFYQRLKCSLMGSSGGRSKSKKTGCKFQLSLVNETKHREHLHIKYDHVEHNHDCDQEKKSKIELGDLPTKQREAFAQYHRDEKTNIKQKQETLTKLVVDRYRNCFEKAESPGGLQDLQVSFYVLINSKERSAFEQFCLQSCRATPCRQQPKWHTSSMLPWV